MADQRNGGIAWTQHTWNALRGCSRVSAGCEKCYAELTAARFMKPGQAYHGLVEIRTIGKGTPKERNEPHWTGRVDFIKAHLEDPIKMRTPKMIFVNSMSDVFHENVPFETIDEIAYVMQKANWHIYQVLTKRAQRLYEWSRSSETRFQLVARNKHIHWGVSIEDGRVTKRIEWLIKTQAPVRWISMEPQIGIVNMAKWLPHKYSRQPKVGTLCEDCFQEHSHPLHAAGAKPEIHWIVVGGESGPGARPLDPEWARLVLGQCRAAGTKFFMKQGSEANWKDFKNIDAFPKDLQVREWPMELPESKQTALI